MAELFGGGNPWLKNFDSGLDKIDWQPYFEKRQGFNAASDSRDDESFKDFQTLLNKGDSFNPTITNRFDSPDYTKMLDDIFKFGVNTITRNANSSAAAARTGAGQRLAGSGVTKGAMREDVIGRSDSGILKNKFEGISNLGGKRLAAGVDQTKSATSVDQFNVGSDLDKLRLLLSIVGGKAGFQNSRRSLDLQQESMPGGLADAFAAIDALANIGTTVAKFV